MNVVPTQAGKRRIHAMQTLDFIVPPQAEGERLDRWLCAAMAQEKLEPSLSRTALQALVKQGAVRVGTDAVCKNYRLTAGETVTISLPDPRPSDVIAQNIPLQIVYEDAYLLVIDKPRGMVVHPAPGNREGTLVNALLWHCAGELSGVGGVERPGIVHRLDKDTSGLLVVAKEDTVHRALSLQLSDHSLYRVYHAVVHGNLQADSGTICAPIARDGKDRKKMAVAQEGKGRPSITHWRVQERFGRYTYVICRLETGRTHQIRVHMAHLGHPIIGDPLYGPRKPVIEGGQCLHAKELSFIHPATGRTLYFETPLPSYFEAVLLRLRKDLTL